MKSTSKEVAVLANEASLDKIPEESVLQDLTMERILKTELERNERRVAYLKFQIDSIMVQELQNIENAIDSSRKTLAGLQTEMNQMGPEISTQKATIDDVCRRDRLQNYSDVTDAVLCKANGYKEMKSTLTLQIRKCDSLYSEIDKLKADISKDCKFITSSREDEQKKLNQVESRTLAAKRYLSALSDEVGLSEKEFENYSAEKTALLNYNSEMENAEKKLKGILEEQEMALASFDELLAAHNVKDSYVQNERDKMDAELQTILDDKKAVLHPADIDDDYNTLQHALTGFKSQLNSLREENAAFESQKREYDEEIASLRCQVGEKKHELKIKQDLETSKTGEEVGELVAAIDVLLNDVNELDEIDGRCLEALRAEASSLEAESESYNYLNDEDAVAVQKAYDELLEEVETSDREIADLQATKNELQDARQKLATVENEHELVLQMVKETVEDLNRVKFQMETQFEKRMDEVDKCINDDAEVVNALAADAYESGLLLAASERDENSIDAVFAEKRSQLWNANAENERKWAKLAELNDTLKTDTANLESVIHLCKDLKKNTIPTENVEDHPLFKELLRAIKLYNAVLKKKQKLEEQKKLMLDKENKVSQEKLERYNYGKFREQNK